MSLTVGAAAPDFSAKDQRGHTHTLSDFRGQWLVLYFYPQDDTPGCTAEACSFRDSYSDLQQLAQVLGVSGDSIASHTQFADKFQLPFPLLSDPDSIISKAYGADGLLFKKRVTFVIDPTGKIAHIYDKVDAKKHADRVLKDLKKLQMTQ